VDKSTGFEVALERQLVNGSLWSERVMDHPSRVEIDLGAVASNARFIRGKVGGEVSIMAVVKADAYGHGAPAVAQTALQNGCDQLAVANMAEALALRERDIDAPILILSYVPAEAIPDAIELRLSLTIFDLASAERCICAARGAGADLKVHLKVDTGMGRLGVLPQSAAAICARLCDAAGIKLEGLYTHFATADDDPLFMQQQLKTFNGILLRIHEAGIEIERIHAANSAALLNCGDSHFNVVRPGVMLYGLAPMPASGVADFLKPAMSWKTKIAQLKTLPPGSRVGYGDAYRTRGEEIIAVVPVGYADGLRRAPYSWREVLIRGRRAPLAGRVSMEKIMLNVSHIPDVKAGDEVVLLGKQGDECISADEIAGWIGSNNYEVVASIAPRLPRTYLSS
jgi:alanine racemase